MKSHAMHTFTAEHFPFTHTEVILAIIVLVPVAVWWNRKYGDLIPAMIMLVGGAFMIYVVPHVPHSPIACLDDPHGSCSKGNQMNWLAGLVFLVPLVIAVIYKALRGDTRGKNGTRLP